MKLHANGVDFTCLCTSFNRGANECSCCIKFTKQVGDKLKSEACQAFYRFFATSLINSIKRSMNVRFNLSSDTKSTLKLAATCDFQQCGTLTSVDSDEPVQPHFKLRNSKCC